MPVRRKRISFTTVHRSSIACPSTSVLQRSHPRRRHYVSQFLFLSCLLILSRSLAERRPQRPPALLRADPKLANAPIHLLPPPSKVFRCHSVRESLLCGLLAADLVGLQATSYARHFMQTVSCILTLEATFESGTGAHKCSSTSGSFPCVRCRR